MSTIKSPDLSISKQDVFVQSTVQNTDLGAKATTGDGRYFRYVYVAGGATALVPGNVIATAAQSTSNYEKLGVSVASPVGSYTITTGSTVTWTVNALSGGYATIASGTGIGYTYKIASNPAVTAATGGVLTLEDPIVVALTTSSTLNLTPSPYMNVIQSPTTLTGTVLGVAVSPIAGSNYGWVQVTGPVGALSDSTLAAVGSSISTSVTTAGAFTLDSGTNTSIGSSSQTQTSAQVGFVFLNID